MEKFGTRTLKSWKKWSHAKILLSRSSHNEVVKRIGNPFLGTTFGICDISKYTEPNYAEFIVYIFLDMPQGFESDLEARLTGPSCPYPSDRSPSDATMKPVAVSSAWTRPSDLGKNESDGRDPPQGVAPHAH